MSITSILSRAALALAFVAAPGLAAAQTSGEESVVVTATRANAGARADLLGSSVTIIEAADLETRQTRVISDVLRDVPGASVSRSGGVGGLTAVRLRGAEANHTLVLIDGMEVADPFQGEFDFATLIADEAAKIEVLRGPQSALYGSDAIGGVIHYITESGAEAPGVRGRLEYGSFKSWDAAVRVADVAGPVDFAVNVGYQATEGTPTARNGVRDVGASNAALSGRFVFTLADNFRIRANGRYTFANADSNDQDFGFPPGPTFGAVIDSDDQTETEGAYGLLGAELETLEGRWSHALTLQGVSAGRNAFSGGALDFGDRGSRAKVSYVTSIKFGGEAFAQTLTAAADVERERFQNRGAFLTPAQAVQREIEHVGFVGQYDAVIHDALGLGLAVRHDDNDRFDNATTYQARASYRFETGTRVHAAGGSGIKNPGIFELFGFDPGSFLGNADLKPERSDGWEAGLEQTFLGGRARLDVTYFDATLKDEILTLFGGPPLFQSTVANSTTESTRKGVEVSGQATLGKSWRIVAAYTYLDAQEAGLEEIRRPPHSGSLNISWRAPDDQFGAFLTARYNGETYDNNFTLAGGPRVLLPAYTLVNAGGDVRISEKLALYARVENATDEDYEDVLTYATPGRAFYVGVRAGF